LHSTSYHHAHVHIHAEGGQDDGPDAAPLVVAVAIQSVDRLELLVDDEAFAAQNTCSNIIVNKEWGG